MRLQIYKYSFHRTKHNLLIKNFYLQKFKFGNRFAKTCRKSFCDKKDKSTTYDERKSAHHRHGHGGGGNRHHHGGNIFVDILSGFADGLTGFSKENFENPPTAPPSTENTTPTAGEGAEKFAQESKTHAKTAENYAKASLNILTNLSQNLADMMDPFGVHFDAEQQQQNQQQKTNDNDKEKNVEKNNAKPSSNDSNKGESVSSCEADNSSDPTDLSPLISQPNSMSGETEKKDVPTVRSEFKKASSPNNQCREWILVNEKDVEDDNVATPPRTCESSASGAIRKIPDYKKLAEELEMHIKENACASLEINPSGPSEKKEPEILKPTPIKMPLYHPGN